MANISRGYSFGTTEQVTAAKLHTLVDGATLSQIVNADIDSNAAIVDTKLYPINTASKVGGAAMYSLSNIPAAAGIIPVANIDVGTAASKIVQLTAAAKIPAVDGSLVTGVVADSMAATGLSTTVAINKGGTGQTTAQAAIDALTAVSAATNEHVLTKDTATGNAIFKATASPSGFSNTIFEWYGFDGAESAYVALEYGNASLIPTSSPSPTGWIYFHEKGSNYKTILTSKFIKIAGINTITCYGRIWAFEVESTSEAFIKFDVGGVNTTAKTTTSMTPTWIAGSATLDITALTNGTVYDITIQLKNEQGTGHSYCSGVILIGS